MLKSLPTLPIVVAFVCFLSPFLAAGQQQTITRYFDSSWRKTSKDSAFFFSDMVKTGDVYQVRSYWMESKRLQATSTYQDTLFQKPVGLLLRYYENGITKDSSYFNPDFTYKNTYHYYPNGKLWAHYQSYPGTAETFTEGFDENGTIIPGFIFEREASFRNGDQGWIRYLSQSINTRVPVRQGAPVGMYKVMIRFIVDKTGKVTNLYPETNFGYGMEEEAMRVIKRSPVWNPAILLNSPVNAYRRQPLTFVVAKN